MNDTISRQDAIRLITGYNGVMDKSVAKRLLIQMPSAQSLTEEDYIELHDRFGTWVEEVVRDMISGEGKRWGNERRHDQQTGGD